MTDRVLILIPSLCGSRFNRISGIVLKLPHYSCDVVHWMLTVDSINQNGKCLVLQYPMTVRCGGCVVTYADVEHEFPPMKLAIVIPDLFV